jgi:hypothetical protein
MDIVELLRKDEKSMLVDGQVKLVNWVAADEIERLRAIMETVADALHDKGDYECWAALRNALWQDGEKE